MLDKSMRGSLQITLARAVDIPALCELLGALFSQEAEFSANPTAQSKGLSAIIDRPNVGHIFVARQDSDVVGMVSLHYTVSTALGGRVALLEDMVVSPTARNAGVGSALLSHAIEFAHSQGCKRITLMTDRNNEAAQRFYQRHGFAASAMMPMRLLFDPADRF
jgi:GNAT superfamily N-acetyltransferase